MNVPDSELESYYFGCKSHRPKRTSFFVEMQISDKRGLEKRIQYYLSQGYCSQINAGDEYPKLKPVIFVGIFDFKYFKNKNKYISRHVFLDIDNHEYSFKDLQMNFIELPKFSLSFTSILGQNKHRKYISCFDAWYYKEK